MWCLSVFFVSAATDNAHLQAIFPYLQQRFGSYTYEDKRLFCLAAKYFYHSLGEDQTSKDHFFQTIKRRINSKKSDLCYGFSFSPNCVKSNNYKPTFFAVIILKYVAFLNHGHGNKQNSRTTA